MVLDTEIMNPVQICSSFLLSFIILNAQPKGFLYDESRVINYELPDPLICLDGTKVVNSKLWINKRRPEIINLFEQEVYGQSPLNTWTDKVRGVGRSKRSFGWESHSQASNYSFGKRRESTCGQSSYIFTSNCETACPWISND